MSAVCDGTDGVRAHMRIVITGASGNVGSAVLRRLSPDGHDLVGVVRRPPGPAGPFADVEWASIDLATGDVDALTAAAIERSARARHRVL